MRGFCSSAHPFPSPSASSIVRAFLIEEQKIVKSVLRNQLAAKKK